MPPFTPRALPVFISASCCLLALQLSQYGLDFRAAVLRGIGDLSAPPGRFDARASSSFLPSSKNIRRADIPPLLFGPSCTDAALSVFCSLFIAAVSLPDQMTDLCRQSGAVSQLSCLRSGAPLPDFWASSTIPGATMQPPCSHYAGAC